MGRRDAFTTTLAVLAAFLDVPRWPQARLAAKVGVGVRALRKCLDAMSVGGRFPLTSEVEGGRVVWTLPATWLPSGVALTKAQAKSTVRLLARTKRTPERDELLRVLLPEAAAAIPARPDPLDGSPDVLAVLEDAVARRAPVRLKYAPVSRAEAKEPPWRVLSIHRILQGEHERFLATSATRKELHVFRVDRVLRAEPAPEAMFRPVPAEEVDAYVAQSIDGFHGGGGAVTCAFEVREPEARWVRTNLPVRGATLEEVAEGLRVQVETTAVTLLARFVVGLGGAGRATTPELAAEVRRLAEGALGAGAPASGRRPVARRARAPARGAKEARPR